MESPNPTGESAATTALLLALAYPPLRSTDRPFLPIERVDPLAALIAFVHKRHPIADLGPKLGQRNLDLAAVGQQHRAEKAPALSLTLHGRFADLFDAVIGADVATGLDLDLGDEIEIAHGLGEEGFRTHGDKPFRVAGILSRTGTPIDRQQKIMVYPLPGADPSVAIEALQSLVPDATYQSDATAETIIARAIRPGRAPT